MKRVLRFAAFLLFGLTAVIIVLGSMERSKNPTVANSQMQAVMTDSRASPLPAPDYSEKLDSAIAQVNEFKASEFTSEARMIALAFGLFNEWAKVADETPANLTDAHAAKRGQLLAALSRKQRQALPALRDAYGPAMRKALWEADGKARTIGGGYRTVEFVSSAFAANRNIKKFHEDLYPTLLQMRFTRAQYKWVDANVEYTYYALKPPEDGVVGIWNRGSFRPVK